MNDAMGIYHVEYTRGSFGLNAVVIANGEPEALTECRLTEREKNVRVRLIGKCTDGSKSAQVVCQEDL